MGFPLILLSRNALLQKLDQLGIEVTRIDEENPCIYYKDNGGRTQKYERSTVNKALRKLLEKKQAPQVTSKKSAAPAIPDDILEMLEAAGPSSIRFTSGFHLATHIDNRRVMGKQKIPYIICDGYFLNAEGHVRRCHEEIEGRSWNNLRENSLEGLLSTLRAAKAAINTDIPAEHHQTIISSLNARPNSISRERVYRHIPEMGDDGSIHLVIEAEHKLTPHERQHADNIYVGYVIEHMADNWKDGVEGLMRAYKDTMSKLKAESNALLYAPVTARRAYQPDPQADLWKGLDSNVTRVSMSFSNAAQKNMVPIAQMFAQVQGGNIVSLPASTAPSAPAQKLGG